MVSLKYVYALKFEGLDTVLFVCTVCLFDIRMTVLQVMITCGHHMWYVSCRPHNEQWNVWRKVLAGARSLYCVEH